MYELPATHAEAGSAAEVKYTNAAWLTREAENLLDFGKTLAEEPPDCGILVSVARNSSLFDALT